MVEKSKACSQGVHRRALCPILVPPGCGWQNPLGPSPHPSPTLLHLLTFSKPEFLTRVRPPDINFMASVPGPLPSLKGILDLCLGTRSEAGGRQRAETTFKGLGGTICKLLVFVPWGHEHCLPEFLSPPIALFSFL